jgi:hypothetical protein
MNQNKQTVSLRKAIGEGFFETRILVILICLVGLLFIAPVAITGRAFSAEIPSYAIPCVWVLCFGFLGGVVWSLSEIISALNNKFIIYRDTLTDTRMCFSRSAVGINGMNTRAVLRLFFKSLYGDFNFTSDVSIFFEDKAKAGKEYYVVLFRGEIKNILDVDEYELSPALMSRFAPDKQALSQIMNWKFAATNNSESTTNSQEQ